MADSANITVNVATGSSITSNIEGGTTISSNVSEGTNVTANVVTGGNGVDGEGVPTGGTTGQVLAKSSSTNYDTEWQDTVPWDIDTDSYNGVTRVRSSTNNYLGNAGFLFWNSGTTSAPDAWTLQGDATIARSSTASIDSYSAQITFGTANTGELYQSVNVSNLVDYTFSAYVQRTSGTGTARLVAQDANSPYTEYASVTLSTESGWQLATLTVKPTNTGQMRFAIKSGNTTASVWLVDECMFQESKDVATTFQYSMLDDSSAQSIYGNKYFSYTSHYTSDILSLYTDYIGGKTDANVSFDLNASIEGTFKITNGNAPANAAASGQAGQIAWDSNYLYICVATNTWKRVAISTW